MSRCALTILTFPFPPVRLPVKIFSWRYSQTHVSDKLVRENIQGLFQDLFQVFSRTYFHNVAVKIQNTWNR